MVEWEDADDLFVGAYTTQLCAISPTSGDSLVHFEVIVATETISIPETVTWWNNYTITNGTTASVDGEFSVRKKRANIAFLGFY